MVAVCMAEVESASAVVSCGAGTIPGSRADTVGPSKLRAAPIRATAAKIAGVPIQPS